MPSMTEARRSNATPSFFINGRYHRRCAADRAQFEALIDEETREGRRGDQGRREARDVITTTEIVGKGLKDARSCYASDEHPTSQSIFERAKQVIPGGVNSPVRAFRSVGGEPVFIAQGDGAVRSPTSTATATSI